MKNNLIAATRTLATTFPTNTGRLAIAILTLISIGLAKIAYNFRQFKKTTEGKDRSKLLENAAKGRKASKALIEAEQKCNKAENTLKDVSTKLDALKGAFTTVSDKLIDTESRMNKLVGELATVKRELVFKEAENQELADALTTVKGELAFKEAENQELNIKFTAATSNLVAADGEIQQVSGGCA